IGLARRTIRRRARCERSCDPCGECGRALEVPTVKLKLGILAGAFNPPTRAHFALLDAASAVVDEAICVVPRTYPHKYFHGADLDRRVEMLQQAGVTCVVTEGGLFIEIARELRNTRPDAEIFFICGRDAAERIVNWDYDEPDTADRMFEEFGMLVAERQGLYVPPDHLRDRILPLNIAGAF